MNESSARSTSCEPAKRLRLHDLSIANRAPTSMRDRARTALAKVRALCFRASRLGLRHNEIAEAIGVPTRTLSTYKAGVTVPHVVVEALESLVMKIEGEAAK